MSLNRIAFGVLAVAVMVAPQALAGDCVCKKADANHPMFCTACGHGEVFTLSVSSPKLFEAIAGTEMDASKSPCKGCQDAAKNNGSCSHCKVSVAGGRVYNSNAAHTMALGTYITDDLKTKASACEGCKKAVGKGGYCDHCQAGVVANRMYKSKEVYEAATKAFAILTKAVQASKMCEPCGVAMVKDGTCDHCKVSFKNGELVKS